MRTTINLLDPSQKQALDGVLNNSKEDVSVIYGPPGTGKSHLILSLLFELAVRGDKVLFVSQNTEALNVIVRMYNKLNKELNIRDGSLNFLDFCWCLNDPVQKRVQYIKQQKTRIMTKPVETMPYCQEELDDDLPYALTYRELDKNENLTAEPDEIGLDELLASSLKNIHHNDIIKDILHTVPNNSYRKALQLLNSYSDRYNLFSELNNPKGPLKYLNPEKTDFNLHNAQEIIEDIVENIEETPNINGLTAAKEVDVNEYLNSLCQIVRYSKIINLNKFVSSDSDFSNILKIAKKRVTLGEKIQKISQQSLPETESSAVLQEKEDRPLLKLESITDLDKYESLLCKIQKCAKLLVTCGIDGNTTYDIALRDVLAEMNFRGLREDDNDNFEHCNYSDLTKIYHIVSEYSSLRRLERWVYDIPKNKAVNNGNINTYKENLEYLAFLLDILKETDFTIQDIIDARDSKHKTTKKSINISEYEPDVKTYTKIINSALIIRKMKINEIGGYTLDNIISIAERQIKDIDEILGIVAKNKRYSSESVEEVVSKINKNIADNNIEKEQSRIEEELKPLFNESTKIETSCKQLLELSSECESLNELLKNIQNPADAEKYTIEKIDSLRQLLITAQQSEILSPKFFTMNANDNLYTWSNHIYTIRDYNRPDEFDAFIIHNRFIKELKETLTPRNNRILDSYLNNEDITFDEFREHMTKDIVGTIYDNAPLSVRKHIANKYFSDYKEIHKKLRMREYISGLQNLKLAYEDPAKTLSFNSNWRPATTNIERISRNSEMISDAFPVTIATPADVAKYIAPRKDFYDYVIFDEASQLLPGQALPSIYRAKKAVIVGDQHQMPPTSTITIGFSGFDGGTDGGLDGSDEKSILDLAINMQLDATYYLKVHYRSESNKLFEPSRKAIYEQYGVQSIYEAKSNTMPLYVEDNLGEDDNRNFSSIIRRIDYYLSKDDKATFCILFTRQDKGGLNNFKKYLEESNNSQIADLYKEDRILISTVTNCQGIEGDHTIMYLPYYNSPRAMWFFNQAAGAYKRLNVSITRQRKTLDVIMGNSKSQWIQVCQDFLDDDNCESNQKISAELLHTLLADAGQIIDEDYLERTLGPNAQNIDSPLTQQLYDKLNEHYDSRLGRDLKIWCEVGWNMIIPNAEAREKNNRNVGFRIDIGIYGVKQKKFILGIEMDGATYHSGFKKEFSDLQRQATLERKGWNIYRIWSTNWLRDTEKEFNDLVQTIDELLAKEEEPEDNRVDSDYDEFNHDNSDVFQHTDSELQYDEPAKQTEPFKSDDNDSELTIDIPTSKKTETEVNGETLVNLMKKCKKNGQPLEIKYSNVPLNDAQKNMVPFMKMYIKEVDDKNDFFLGSFELTSSPYRIKISDVFEYKNNEISNQNGIVQSIRAEESKTTDEPDASNLIMTTSFLETHLGKDITFKYQSKKKNSGKNWRTYKLVKFNSKYFYCTSDKFSGGGMGTFRRDQVLEIKD
ncbi:hypothetical protein IJI89_04015 [Candidatus Saccharibacteria bacterium]|nr:hypothetical protein [Candidatus Saccharibacteria bacterium]